MYYDGSLWWSLRYVEYFPPRKRMYFDHVNTFLNVVWLIVSGPQFTRSDRASCGKQKIENPFDLKLVGVECGTRDVTIGKRGSTLWYTRFPFITARMSTYPIRTDLLIARPLALCYPLRITPEEPGRVLRKYGLVNCCRSPLGWVELLDHMVSCYNKLRGSRVPVQFGV